MGGSLRIWYQSTTELAAYPQYANSLRRHFAETFPDGDVAVDLFGVPAGTWAGQAPSAYIASPISYVRMLSASLFENVIAAEERGYDAFVIGSYTEPFLRECRSLVDIPVVAVTESSLLVACSFAKTFALVTLNDENVWFLKNAVERHGLGGRVSGIYPVRHVMDELDINALFSDPLPYAAEFTEVARIAVEAFADLIVPAEGLVAELVHNAWPYRGRLRSAYWTGSALRCSTRRCWPGCAARRVSILAAAGTMSGRPTGCATRWQEAERPAAGAPLSAVAR